MAQQFGVRWRLLLAFFGISAFAILAAVAAVYSILAVGSVLERTTKERVPSALASLEISRQAERIVAAAPALLAATTGAQREELRASINNELKRLEGLVGNLMSTEVDPSSLESIEVAVVRLGENLVALDFLVSNHLAASQRKKEILDRLSFASKNAQRQLTPGLTVMDAKFLQLRNVIGDPTVSVEARSEAMNELTATIANALPLQKSQVEISTINDTLVRAATAATRAELDEVSFPVRKSLRNLDRLIVDLKPELRLYMQSRLEEFGAFAAGPDSIVEARGKELDLVASGERLIGENAELSRQLTEAVDRLLVRVKEEIATGNVEASSVQRASMLVMGAVVALSLISSTLIVWLYVGRNLIARLTELSDSMLAIAGGNLRASLPESGTDEIGRMAEALTVFRDTAVEVEESNLREIDQARRRLTAAIESISEGFSLYDADDRLVLCNSTYRELLYPGIEEVVTPGTPFATIIRSAAERGLIADAEGCIDEWVAERLERHRNPEGSHVQRRADGRWVQVSEFRTDDGGTVAVYNDITEMKRRERELEEMDRLKSNFLSSVSHELRTPLTSVRGFAKLIAKDFSRRFMPLVGEDAKLRKHADRIGDNLEIIVGEAERLTRLINDVLDISKIESGATEWRDEKVNVREVVNQVFSAALGQFAENSAVKAHLSIADNLPVVLIDRDRLMQVLVNLLHNAAKFTDAGKVELMVGTTDEGWVSFAVRDTGRGIPPEEQKLVFDKFHQVTKSDTLEDKPKGTGLGLTICRQIVEHYGGRIWVESEVGVGSTFIFVLPPAGRAADVTTVAGEATTAVPTGDRARDAPLIMAVDDDPAIRTYLAQLLGDEGYRVVTAENGARALELARGARPNLITMDLMMPGIDGKTVISELRRESSLRDVPIIVVSVLADRHDAGADVSLGKPIDEARLLASTRLLLNRSARRAGAPDALAREQFLVVDMPGRRTRMPPLPDSRNDIRHCPIGEFKQHLQNGFDGTVVLAAEAIRELDLQGILETSKVRGVVISSLEP